MRNRCRRDSSPSNAPAVRVSTATQPVLLGGAPPGKEADGRPGLNARSQAGRSGAGVVNQRGDRAPRRRLEGPTTTRRPPGRAAAPAAPDQVRPPAAPPSTSARRHRPRRVRQSRRPRCWPNGDHQSSDAAELTYGTCRTRGLVDVVIAAAAVAGGSDRPVLLDLLRLRACQLAYQRRRKNSSGVHHGGTGRPRIRLRPAQDSSTRCYGEDLCRDVNPAWLAELAPPLDPIGHAALVHAHPRWIAQACHPLGAEAR